MEPVLGAWGRLSLRGQIAAIASAVIIILSVLMLARTASAPRMSLLYAGLEPASAGEVVAALESQGAVVDVRGNAIYVESKMRDSLRLALANEGMPSTGGRGYELLDSLTGFGTTSQMFDAVYWRAKEGELARTIASSRYISAARVHLSTPSSNPFNRGQVAGASISVTTTGGTLSVAQARALRHLVASAVTGLNAQDVTLVDSQNGVVPLENSGAFGGELMSATREENLRANITRLVEARVGRGNAIVEVNIESETEREVISERIVDPDSRIAISSDIEETNSTANDSRANAVSVASNLPSGDSGGADRSSQSNETNTREVFNYEVSEIQRDIQKEPGTLKRLTVAVLVNGLSSIGDNGEPEWIPRGDSELEDLRALVASAVGFDETRGDTITIRSMQLEELPAPPEPTPPSLFQSLDLDVMSLLQIATLAVVAIILGLFVLRPILMSSLSATASKTASAGQLQSIGDLPALDGPLLDSSIDMDEFAPPLADLPTLNAENPSERLRRLIDDRKDESVEILSNWMNDEPEQVR